MGPLRIERVFFRGFRRGRGSGPRAVGGRPPHVRSARGVLAPERPRRPPPPGTNGYSNYGPFGWGRRSAEASGLAVLWNREKPMVSLRNLLSFAKGRSPSARVSPPWCPSLRRPPSLR